MHKLKNEAALFKEALLAGVKYAEGRGAVEFEATDSASEKLLYIYRLLVHDKVIQPLPEELVVRSAKTITLNGVFFRYASLQPLAVYPIRQGSAPSLA